MEVFIKPLFVPSQHLSFNVGWRLGGGSHTWNADAPNLIAELGAAIKREALPFLARIQSPKDLADLASAIHPTKGLVLEEATYTSEDPIKQQAIAYALARAGEVRQAEVALDRLVGLLNADIGWQREMADRARALKSQLVNDPAGAQKQLDVWEAETAKNLCLEEFR